MHERETGNFQPSIAKLLKARAWIVTGVFVGAGSLVFLISYVQRPPLLGYKDHFASNKMSEWTIYGGSWRAKDAILSNYSGARGDKAVVGSANWTDYTVESDVRFDSNPAGLHWGDTGVIFRVTDPAVGVDAYNGYYAGLSYEDQLLFIGKATFAWNRLATSRLEHPLTVGRWHHLKAMAKGCYIQAEVSDEENIRRAGVSFFDEGCQQKSGAAGVRTFGVQASWKEFHVSRIH